MPETEYRSRKVGKVILVVSIVTVLLILLVLFTGLKDYIIRTPSSPSVGETTTSRLILQGISVYEDEGLTRSVQTIDWGHVESNHSYSHTLYVRNDHDWGDRDIVWQRLNVNPNSVYISIKCNYGDRQIAPNEVRQVIITLTVLGLFDSSGKLSPNAEVPQFTFDLKLIGQDLSIYTYMYIRLYTNRDANNITVVYKDDLKETILVVIEIKQRKDYLDVALWPVVWNTTKYASEFTETWLDADIHTDYQVVVTINHERYGKDTAKWYLVGQLP